MTSTTKAIGLIGGSGLLYGGDNEGERIEVSTKFGKVVCYKLQRFDSKLNVYFVQRHQADTNFDYSQPHNINHPAILTALATFNVEFIFSICSVGSLKPQHQPGAIFIADDYFCPWDIRTTFEGFEAHCMPIVDQSVRELIGQALDRINLKYVNGGVYANTTGPRLESKAEIKFLADYADVVGMTAAHEAVISAELKIPYAMVCMVDNMANGIQVDGGDGDITVDSIVKLQKENKSRCKKIVEEVFNTFCALEGAEPEFDSIIHAKHVVSVDDKNTIWDSAAIGIKNGVITRIASSKEALEWNTTGAEVSHHPDGIIMPGLINAHTHVPMSYFRGCGDDLELQAWLTTRIWPTEAAHLNAEFVGEATEFAIAEMILGGTTCFNDMYFFAEETAKQVYKTGMRGVMGAVLIEFPSAYAKDSGDYLCKGRTMIEQFKDMERVHFAVAPHSPYTVSDASLKECYQLSKEYNIPFHIHLHETHSEVHDSENRNETPFKHTSDKACRPLKNLLELGIVDHSFVAVHMTQLTDNEIAEYSNTKGSVVHCPRSNLKLASGMCPIHKLKEAGVNVALGTDGAGCNNSLDMFSEMKLASLLSKGVTGNAESMNAADSIRMATINGAKALGLQDKLGSIEVGKYADVIVVDTSSVNMMPMYDPASNLVYCCERGNVTNVWIHGKQVLKNRQLTTIDLSTVKNTCQKHFLKIQETLDRLNQ